MRLKPILSALAILTISGCSLLSQQPREVEIVTKSIKLDIIQPTLPRPVELKEPRWYVVSDKKIANEDRTYLDKFIEDIKKKHGGDIVFVAIQTPHIAKYGGQCPIPDDREDFDYTWLINCIKQIKNA